MIDKRMTTPTNNYTTAARLQLLIDITRDLDLNLDKLLSQILDRMQSVIPLVDIGAIYLYDHQKQAHFLGPAATACVEPGCVL